MHTFESIWVTWWKGLVFVALVSFALVVVPISSTSIGEFSPVPRQTRTSEAVLRAQAIDIARPVCPEDGVPEGATIVGVAQVQIVGSGRVLHVNVLEPSSGSIARAIERGVMSSKFHPLELRDGHPEIQTAKLTFYFRRHATRCEVLHPSEVGGGTTRNRDFERQTPARGNRATGGPREGR
jgi:hypothetical protein